MTTGLIVNSAGAFFGQVVSLFYGTTISTELGDDTYLLSMSDMWLCAAVAPALVAPWCFFVIEVGQTSARNIQRTFPRRHSSHRPNSLHRLYSPHPPKTFSSYQTTPRMIASR